MKRIIYILTNEAIPGLCKIGYTDRSLEDRLGELSRQTGVPLPFECFYAKKIELNAKKIESWLHELFKEQRLNPRKEFFTISPEKVVLALKFIEGEEIILKQNVIAEDKQEIKVLEKITSRRDRFNFRKVKIPVGSVLTFIYDKSIFCRVLVSGKVEFRGKNLSISEAARLAYNKEYEIAGPLYWKYRGKTLDERRRIFDDKI